MSAEPETPMPPGGEDESPPKAKKKKKSPKKKGDPLAWGRLPLAILRRPLAPGVGVLACALASLVGVLLGSSGEALFNLVSYLPFLGGSWAVLAAATSTEDRVRAQLPGVRPALTYAATALVVVVVSGIADVTLTIIGGMIVRTALALGPTVALAESLWPHRSLWRGLLVIDGHPRDFVKVAALSFAVALVFVLLVGLAANDLFGQAASGRLTDGASRGIGSVIVGALWMRFYLKVRHTVA